MQAIYITPRRRRMNLDHDAHAGLIAGRHTPQAVRVQPEPRTTRRQARQMDRIASITIVCALIALAILTR